MGSRGQLPLPFGAWVGMEAEMSLPVVVELSVDEAGTEDVREDFDEEDGDDKVIIIDGASINI